MIYVDVLAFYMHPCFGAVCLQAYRLKAKSLHPDKAAQQGISKETAERQFHDLAEAYEVHPWFRRPWFKDPPVIATHRATSCADTLQMVQQHHQLCTA